jgi:DNA adenine methylase
MKYMGSKARIVHEILPIMLDKEHDTFVDAFCGGCSVIENVPDTYRRIANDKNKYLIEMWKYLLDGGFVFDHISKTLYNFARDCYHGKNNFFTDAGVGLIGFMASFNGRFFDGGYSGHNVVGKNGKARDYIREQIENTMRDVPLLKGVEFYSGSYDELVIPDRSIVYCDLPYKATKKYDVSKNFDYESFYIWCMEMARRGHKVFISEYQMPQEFRCVWEKEVTNSLNPNITKRPVERLFTID